MGWEDGLIGGSRLFASKAIMCVLKSQSLFREDLSKCEPWHYGYGYYYRILAAWQSRPRNTPIVLILPCLTRLHAACRASNYPVCCSWIVHLYWCRHALTLFNLFGRYGPWFRRTYLIGGLLNEFGLLEFLRLHLIFGVQSFFW